MKTIEIKEYQKEYKTNSDASESVVVSIPIVSNVDGVVDKTEIITYEFDKEYDQYFCYDRCDGIVVQLFWHAMRTKYDNIVCKYPMSELLWYNLTYIFCTIRARISFVNEIKICFGCNSYSVIFNN